jgi:hypothetical protein
MGLALSTKQAGFDEEKAAEPTRETDIKNAAKALVSLHIDEDQLEIAEAVRLSRVLEGLFPSRLLTALQKMAEVFGQMNPAGVGLTVGDSVCDEARAVSTDATRERM